LRRRIRINPDKSPINLIKNKSNKDNEKIDFEKRIENVNEALNRAQTFSERYEYEQKIGQLLTMMYLDDIDADFVKNSMKISDDELESMVEKLIELGYLHYVSDDEVELTKDGVFHVVTQNTELFE